jgi:hypothetical protein
LYAQCVETSGDVDGPAAPGGSAAYLIVQTSAFVAELAMFATLGVAGWQLGEGALMSVALAALYPALAILSWSVLMAPTSRRRLADPWRLVLQIALFVATGVLSALAGNGLWGTVVAAFGIAAFIAGRFYERAEESVDSESR